MSATPTAAWTDRNPLFQSFSNHYLRQLAVTGTAKDKRAAKAELQHRDATR